MGRVVRSGDFGAKTPFSEQNRPKFSVFFNIHGVQSSHEVAGTDTALVGRAIGWFKRILSVTGHFEKI